MTDNQCTSSPPSPGSFTIEHLKELDFLKDYGTIVPLTANEERLLDEIAASGFAKKEGLAYVYLDKRNERQVNQEIPQSSTSQIAGCSENAHALSVPSPDSGLRDVVDAQSSKPARKEPELLDVVSGPPSRSSANNLELAGIGGWLLLFSIGLVTGNFVTGWSIYSNFSLLAGRIPSDLKTALVIENGLLIALGLFQAVVTVAFFRRRSTAPTLVIALIVARVGYNLIDLIFAAAILGDSPGARDLASSGVYAAIWISYFLHSKRVKATFIRGPVVVPDDSQFPRSPSAQATGLRTTGVPSPETANVVANITEPAAVKRIPREHASTELSPSEALDRVHHQERRLPQWVKVGIGVVGLMVLGVAIVAAGSWMGLPSNKSIETTLFANNSPAVAQVVVQDRRGNTISSGSGFLVSRDGLFATNHHVIEKAHSAHLLLVDGTKLTVSTVTSLDKEADLAILKVAGKVVAHPLELAGPEVPPVGTKVFAIGNPLGLANTMSDGLVSGIRNVGQIAMIQTSAPISAGSSGGPLLGADGRVVGVTTFLFKEGQNLNFAVPATRVASLLHRAKGEGQQSQRSLVRRLDAIACTDRGQAWLSKGKYDDAIGEYDQALQFDPENTLALVKRGIAWAAKRDYVKAINDYDEAIRLDPNDSFAYDCRGNAWARKENHDRAIKDYDEAIKLDPKNASVRTSRAYAWMEKKEYDKAIRDCGEAIRLDPKCESAHFCRGDAWMEKKEYDKAIVDFTDGIRLLPELAFPYILRANAWMAKSDYGRAIKDFDEAIRLDPKQSSAYFKRGKAKFNSGKFDEAIEDFDEAIRLDPGDAVAFDRRGDAWIAKKEYDKAISDYGEAIRLDPLNTFFYNDRGNAWLAKKDFAKAFNDLDEAIRLAPKNATAYASRGDAWMDKKAYDMAVRDYDTAIRFDPKDWFPYYRRAKAWIALKDYDKAMQYCEEGIRLNPRSALILNLRVEVWIARKDFDRVIEHYSEAIQVNPKDASNYGNRGVFLTAKKDFDRAIRDFDTAIQLDPNSAWAFGIRAKAWIDKKEYRKVLDDFNEAIRLDPKSEHAYGDFGWFLATCPDEKFRDGTRAVQMATKACELSGWKSGPQMENLAAAYAEAGQFDQAERYQRKALADPDCSSDAKSRRRLEIYGQRKPVREGD
jgi:tetratricopeptide (TPR) repeat protein